jgi:hypothetical protein
MPNLLIRKKKINKVPKTKDKLKMIKQIIKFGFIIGMFYGLYYLASLFPLESVILIGIILICILFYWISELF